MLILSRPTYLETHVRTIFTILLTLILSLPAYAEKVEILMVKAIQSDGLWSFDVTVRHPDASIDHMMDSIAIFLPNDEQLAFADVPLPSIGAPHMTTQLTDIKIPEGIEYVVIRGRCSKDGWNPEGLIIALM